MAKILIACEESQTVCKAFRSLGHDAFSCDLQPCSGGHPEWHYQADVREFLTTRFDLVVFHPVCKYLSNSGVRWLSTDTSRWAKLKAGIEFFNLRHQFNSPRVATENPIPHFYAKHGFEKHELDLYCANGIGMYQQTFQPWHFGHKKMKQTCLWLKGLPQLKYTNVVGPPPKDKELRKKWQDVWLEPPGPDREKKRSVTYPGIAEAMATQWGIL